MGHCSEKKVTLSMLDAQVQLINALAEILAKGINYKGLPEEDATECDVCERPCPDGELRCCEDHDLQAIGLMEESKKYVDEDLLMERNRDLNFGKEE